MFSELFRKSIDERAERATGHSAMIFLGLTQVMLAGVLFYRLYILGQPDEQVRDLQAVLLISIFGYIGFRLWVGGILPTLSLKSALIAYVLLSGLIVSVCLLMYGIPRAEEWQVTWLPALSGPAIMIGLYAVFAELGRRRLDRQIDGDD